VSKSFLSKLRRGWSCVLICRYRRVQLFTVRHVAMELVCVAFNRFPKSISNLWVSKFIWC